LLLPAKGPAAIRLRWRQYGAVAEPFSDFDDIIEARREEADEFYAAVQVDMNDADARAIQR
jgi:hypothetical protein